MDSSAIIEAILVREGSIYTDAPDDKGGPTKFGITLPTLQLWRHGATLADLVALSIDDARQVYKFVFVTPFIAYPEPFLGLIVGSAVQHGKGRIEGWLTTCGDYASFLRKRISFYGEIVIAHPSQLKWLRGWLNRVILFVR